MSRSHNHIGIKITFENVRHFADLRERGSVGPSVHYVHEMRTELVQVGVLIHVQLRFGWDFSDALGTFLSIRTIRFRLNKTLLQLYCYDQSCYFLLITNEKLKTSVENMGWSLKQWIHIIKFKSQSFCKMEVVRATSQPVFLNREHLCVFCFFMPPPLRDGDVMFSACLSVHLRFWLVQ